MIVVNNIYELEEEEKVQQKKTKSQIIDRKLGTVTYIKWGTVYNYLFSFDITKGRLLCYKSENSKKPSNYYSLIQGTFLNDTEEISKKESGYQKKKNYIPQKVNIKILNLFQDQSTLYVKTKKGKTFRLIVSEKESLDKIMGYLQICFQSKIETKSFFALLGMVMIEVNSCTYKLMTGILVPLDDWRSSTYNQNYLHQQQGGLQIISQNLTVLSAIVSIFQSDLYLGVVFNPILQTLDVVRFDQNLQPSYLLKKVFILTKNQHKEHNNQQQQFMKLNTIVQMDEEDDNFDQLFSNQELKVYVNKNYNLNYQALINNMYQLEMQEEISEEINDQDSQVVNSCLDYYKKHIKQAEHGEDDSKEFIIFKRVSENVQIILHQFLFLGKSHQKPIKIVKLLDQLRIPCTRRRINITNQMCKCQNEKIKRKKSKDLNQAIIVNRVLIGEEGQRIKKEFHPHLKRNGNYYQRTKNSIYRRGRLISMLLNYWYIQRQLYYIGYDNIIDYSIKFNFIQDSTDFRHSSGYKNGGIMCVDKQVVNNLRNTGKQMIKEIGRKIISGNFNLTTVSFPVIQIKLWFQNHPYNELLCRLYIFPSTLIEQFKLKMILSNV